MHIHWCYLATKICGESRRPDPFLLKSSLEFGGVEELLGFIQRYVGLLNRAAPPDESVHRLSFSMIDRSESTLAKVLLLMILESILDRFQFLLQVSDSLLHLFLILAAKVP